MSDFEISINIDKVSLIGHLTKSYLVPDIMKYINISELDIKDNTIYFDLESVTKIDTVGLASLMQWMRQLNTLGIDSRFINTNEVVNYACKLYGVNDVFA